MTGDWGGVRTELENFGINFQLNYQQHFQTNVHGGVEMDNGFGASGSYDLVLNLDFQRMKLVPGGSFYMKSKGNWSTWPTTFDREKIGGLSRTNADAAADKPIYVDKWWWRQELFDGKLEFRLGKLDTAKDLFDVSEIAGDEDKRFLNSFLVTNPTIAHRKGIGAFIVVRPTEWLYVQAAAVDAEGVQSKTGFETAFHDDDLFVALGEIGFTPKFETDRGPMPGVYRAGVWHNPQTRDVFFDTKGGRFATRRKTGDTGFYAGFDQLIWKERDEPKDKQGLSVFGRYGYAHDDVNRIEHFWSTGAQYVGPIPERDQDILGFGIAQAIVSDQYRVELDALADRETVYELYYAIQLAPWLVLTPDIQFVKNPGGDSNDHDAVVANVRLRVTF